MPIPRILYYYYSSSSFSTHVPRKVLTSPVALHYRRRPAMTPVSSSPTSPPTDRRPVVVSGPSGVGKGTLYGRLFRDHAGVFALSVSHTTRSPRAGEKEGREYHFVTPAQFNDLVARDAFVEHATFGGNSYGTSKMTIEEKSASGNVVVLDIEMEGVKQIKSSGIDARFVFIAPPSEDVLEKRLRGRGTESEASIQKRLAQAKRELDFARTPGVHDKVIVNDDLDAAYAELERWVYAPAEMAVTEEPDETRKTADGIV